MNRDKDTYSVYVGGGMWKERDRSSRSPPITFRNRIYCACNFPILSPSTLIHVLSFPPGSLLITRINHVSICAFIAFITK